jgi:hypothetical protein
LDVALNTISQLWAGKDVMLFYFLALLVIGDLARQLVWLDNLDHIETSPLIDSRQNVSLQIGTVPKYFVRLTPVLVQPSVSVHFSCISLGE